MKCGIKIMTYKILFMKWKLLSIKYHILIIKYELFNHIFRNMNMENHFQNQGMGHHVSSVCFINGQRVERVTENINGVTRQTTFISGNQPKHGINIIFN